MKAVMIGFASVVMTAGVIFNAYSQKKQFYPTVVYITKSSPSMAILYLQAFVLVMFLGKVMRKVFFGQLRPAEMEHLIERSWYAVTETCLAFTVFRDDFSPRFVALFTILLFLKCFHWLAEDRIDYMERSPVISVLFHARAVALMTLLCTIDLYFVNHAYDNMLIKGPSVQLVFGFEYAILLTMVAHVLIKYLLHTIDLRSENPWENKAVYLLYAELILGLIKVILYILFLAIMMKVHTFPLFVVRPMYLTVREFKKAMNDVILSRRAIHNMNTLYPTATAEELASGDNVCIICREEMHSNAKKLPCNHIFHTNCLRSWFQRQQTCPTCRMDVFRNVPASAANRQQQQGAAAAAAAPNAQQQQPAAAAENANFQQQPQLRLPLGVPNFHGFMPHNFYFPPPQGFQPQPPPTSGSLPSSSPLSSFSSLSSSSTSTQQPAAAAAATATTSSMGPIPSSQQVPHPFIHPSLPSFHPSMMSMMMPPVGLPFGFQPPFGAASPPVAPSLIPLTTFELRAMEGQLRRNVEARIQCLADIQTLLEAAVNQMQQYMSVVVATAAASNEADVPSTGPAGGGGSGLATHDGGLHGGVKASEADNNMRGESSSSTSKDSDNAGSSSSSSGGGVNVSAAAAVSSHVVTTSSAGSISGDKLNSEVIQATRNPVVGSSAQSTPTNDDNLDTCMDSSGASGSRSGLSSSDSLDLGTPIDAVRNDVASKTRNSDGTHSNSKGVGGSSISNNNNDNNNTLNSNINLNPDNAKPSNNNNNNDSNNNTNYNNDTTRDSSVAAGRIDNDADDHKGGGSVEPSSENLSPQPPIFKSSPLMPLQFYLESENEGCYEINHHGDDDEKRRPGNITFRRGK